MHKRSFQIETMHPNDDGLKKQKKEKVQETEHIPPKIVASLVDVNLFASVVVLYNVLVRVKNYYKNEWESESDEQLETKSGRREHVRESKAAEEEQTVFDYDIAYPEFTNYVRPKGAPYTDKEYLFWTHLWQTQNSVFLKDISRIDLSDGHGRFPFDYMKINNTKLSMINMTEEEILGISSRDYAKLWALSEIKQEHIQNDFERKYGSSSIVMTILDPKGEEYEKQQREKGKKNSD